MTGLDDLTRKARRLAQRLPGRSGLEPGGVPLEIGALISPLRYDVLVRAAFFEFLDRNPSLQDDIAALGLASREHPYRRWYDTVGVHRIRPGASPRQAEDAFTERLEQSVRLLRSFTASGFDARYPIVVRSAPHAATATGKRLAGRHYPIDGCHRLALLHWSGHRMLQPAWYRIRSGRGWHPPDNTAALIAALGLDAATYYAFLSVGYGTMPCTDEASLLRQLAEASPSSLAEVRRIISIDGPLLAGSAGAAPSLQNRFKLGTDSAQAPVRS